MEHALDVTLIICTPNHTMAKDNSLTHPITYLSVITKTTPTGSEDVIFINAFV